MSTQTRAPRLSRSRPLARSVARSLSFSLCLPMLLAACGGGGGGDRSGGSSASAAVADGSRPLSLRTYERVCINCHLENGKGMPPAYRSLVGSAWVTGNPDRTIAIVLYGVQGPVVDTDYTYHTAMLPYGSGMPMTDEEVAAVVTHIRTSWGNTAGAVTAADVARVKGRFGARTKGFTQAELDAMGS